MSGQQVEGWWIDPLPWDCGLLVIDKCNQGMCMVCCYVLVGDTVGVITE